MAGKKWNEMTDMEKQSARESLECLYGDRVQVDTVVKQRRKKRRMNRESHEVQIPFVEWCRWMNVPVIKITNEGGRSAWEMNRFKLEGLWPGASDVLIPRASKGGLLHGYFVELKAPGEKPRGNQLEFMQAMRDEGYKAEWFDDWQKAAESVCHYLGLEWENER